MSSLASLGALPVVESSEERSVGRSSSGRVYIRTLINRPEIFILTLSILTAFMYCPEKALGGSQSTAAFRRPETSIVCAALMRRALAKYFFSGRAPRSPPLLFSFYFF
jgi:hypothetical protein